MKYNVCKSCGAKDGKAGLLINDECLKCHRKNQGKHDMTRIYYKCKYMSLVVKALRIIGDVCFGGWLESPEFQCVIDSTCYNSDGELERCVLQYKDNHPHIVSPILTAFVEGYIIGNGGDIEDFT